MMRISLTYFNFLISILLFLVFLGNLSIAQDDHTACILVAEDKDYFTYVEPPLYFRSTPREDQVKTATINVTYNGFSAEAETAFQYAVDILETEITSSVTIELIANWVSLDPGVLGSAGANGFWRDFTNAPLANTWYPVALANKLAGFDISGTHDINANFNSDFENWYLGTDGNTPGGQYDFVSVVLHEIIHGLGFSGSMSVSGAVGSWGLGSGFPFVYDVNAVNGSNQSLLNTTLFHNPSVALGTQLTSNNIFFEGANAVIGNGGTNPKLYTPATWNPGSSYSHWDETTYPAGNINSLMTYAIGAAEAIHHPGFITRGLLKDNGWTIDQPLPVELSSFTARVLINDGVQLNWTTETEVDNYGFEVQRSEVDVKSSDWKKITFVEGHGNSNSPKEYEFLDRGISYGSYSYRLKQIDNDGTFEYSDVLEVNAGDIPDGFVLEQNYPNPFNPNTIIKFAVDAANPTTLKVYDILGNEIAQLFNEITEAGKVYEIEFDASYLSSGVYYYRLSTPQKSLVRKMLLLR